MVPIESDNNPKLKWLKKLLTHRGRTQEGFFLIEGKRELLRAQKARIAIQSFFLSPKAWDSLGTSGITLKTAGSSTFKLSERLFKQISLRENPDGFLGVAPTWASCLKKIPNASTGLYLLVESLEKPGNLGALMRSAEAAGVTGMLIADPTVDIFNPHVIRTSQGAVFALPIAWESKEVIFQVLSGLGLQLIATTPEGKHDYWSVDLRGGSVVCVGNEARGLSDFWLQKATQVCIPMHGESADSLNANIAGTLCLYEALRQRK